MFSVVGGGSGNSAKGIVNTAKSLIGLTDDAAKAVASNAAKIAKPGEDLFVGTYNKSKYWKKKAG